MQQHYLPHPKACQVLPWFHFCFCDPLRQKATYVHPQPLVTEDYYGEVKAASHHTSLEKSKERQMRERLVLSCLLSFGTPNQGMALSTFRQSPSQINKGNLENPPQTCPQAILI